MCLKHPGYGLLLAIGIIFSPASDAQELLSKEYLQQMYVDFLNNEGYRATVDRDGDVQFKHESKVYYIDVTSDFEFFRIVLANIWSIESTLERQKVLMAAAYSNAEVKVAKVFTVKDNVWLSIEVFVSKPEHFKGIFKRSMSALQTATNIFVKKMKDIESLL